MRKIFVAVLTLAGLALTPTIASARAPQWGGPSFQVDENDYRDNDFRHTRGLKSHLEDSLARINIDIERGFRRGVITPREMRNLRREMRTVRQELRQALRFDGRIGAREGARLTRRLNDLEQRVAFARHNRRDTLAWR